MKDISCHMPWTWLEINIANGKIRSCGRTPWVDDQTDFFNNKFLIERRQEFLQGSRPIDCKSCWILEDNNQLSKRQFSKQISILQTNNFDLYVDFPRMLSINLGNLCNLACVYCSEKDSTIWAVEKNIPIVNHSCTDFETSAMKWIESVIISEELTNIELIGGEVTIMPSLYTILDKIVALRTKPLGVVLYSNAMFNDSHFSRIQKYVEENKHIKFLFRISIESVGESAEFIRTGLKWDKFNNNFKQLHNLSLINENLSITVIPTLNLYCLENLQNFLYWLDSFGQYTWLRFGINHVSGPAPLAISTLGVYCRQLVNVAPIYNNAYINKYAQEINQFINSFNDPPCENYLKIIQDGYIKNGIRSGIEPSSVIPKLIELIGRDL